MRSQPTQCAYIRLAKGLRPLGPPPGETAPLRRFGPAADVAVVRSRARRIMTARRFVSTRPVRSSATPPSDSSSCSERGSFAGAPALRVTSRPPGRAVAVAAERRRSAREPTEQATGPTASFPPARPRRTPLPLRHGSRGRGDRNCYRTVKPRTLAGHPLSPSARQRRALGALQSARRRRIRRRRLIGMPEHPRGRTRPRSRVLRRIGKAAPEVPPEQRAGCRMACFPSGLRCR